ncbi:MAG: polysaccharide biosynthesis/export family protein [Luteolibacter sp.]|uniref:polysaccharide biosynthesis/export family protein n=1 Tax=Luteolibacter sp. TaxID=1962973 RepID=UPI0032648AE9
MNFKNLLRALFALIFISATASAQIQAGKAINITISNVPSEDKAQVNGVYPVSDNGMINMPMLGQVHAAGMSNAALQSSLESLYKGKGIYTNPTIQVIVSNQNGNVVAETVTVGGFVRQPGPVPYAKELTLWQAIQAAGGATEFGSMRRVKLFRDGNQKTYDATKAQFMSIPLQRNDTIEIPQKTPWGT